MLLNHIMGELEVTICWGVNVTEFILDHVQADL